MPEGIMQIGIIVLFFVIIYFMMIRPQRKKEKEITAMRNALKVGDRITTIGGIKGRVVKVSDDAIVIAVGSDKVKLEMTRWSVSNVEKEGAAKASSPAAKADEKNAEEKAEEERKPRKPKKLSAKSESTEDDAATEEEPVNGETEE
jgi:preprotein translocase YajC subunit